MILSTVHHGRDNKVEISLLEDGVVKDLTSVTRMALTVGQVNVDSNTTPAAFNWRSDPNKVALSLGQVNLEIGTHAAQLVVYTAASPNGLIWGEEPWMIKVV